MQDSSRKCFLNLSSPEGWINPCSRLSRPQTQWIWVPRMSWRRSRRWTRASARRRPAAVRAARRPSWSATAPAGSRRERVCVAWLEDPAKTRRKTRIRRRTRPRAWISWRASRRPSAPWARTWSSCHSNAWRWRPANRCLRAARSACRAPPAPSSRAPSSRSATCSPPPPATSRPAARPAPRPITFPKVACKTRAWPIWST